jgi:carboxypeptidase Taq
MTTSMVTSLFDGMEPRLRELLGRISERPQPDDSFLHTEYPVDLQERFGKQLLGEMGYDFRRGRLDVSAHPFSTTLGRDDVRLTTRYNPHYFKTSVFGTIHEGGHGLYELGFDPAFGGTILADAASLGIHESQSRLWENMIGRSLPFWDCHLPSLREIFPGQLDGVTPERFYRAVNRVEPSLIRVEADEVTYNLHIILRFRLETALLANDLRVDDLPAAWNEQSSLLLGIRPDRDAVGVLQDVHWSLGLFGYFPTYALGNLYAARFLETMRGDIPDLDDRIRKGNLTAILDWLRGAIHRHGSVYPASELCRRVTGSELAPDAFIEYLERKYAAVYGF